VTKDPLAGQRQAINDHEATALFFPLMVGGKEQRCPVQVGQIHFLRSCTIEITRTERTKRYGKRAWMATFTRTERSVDRVRLLSHSGEGYVSDPKLAAKLNEDVFHKSPETIDVIDEGDRSDAHKNAGEPLEPEAVPPHEIKSYRGSRDAHQRYLLEMGAARVAEQEQPLELRLAKLRAKSKGQHVDISGELRIIERQVAKAERKVLEKAA
jgi:hypothetical protein